MTHRTYKIYGCTVKIFQMPILTDTGLVLRLWVTETWIYLLALDISKSGAKDAILIVVCAVIRTENRTDWLFSGPIPSIRKNCRHLSKKRRIKVLYSSFENQDIIMAFHQLNWIYICDHLRMLLYFCEESDQRHNTDVSARCRLETRNTDVYHRTE